MGVKKINLNLPADLLTKVQNAILDQSIFGHSVIKFFEEEWGLIKKALKLQETAIRTWPRTAFVKFDSEINVNEIIADPRSDLTKKVIYSIYKNAEQNFLKSILPKGTKND